MSVDGGLNWDRLSTVSGAEASALWTRLIEAVGPASLLVIIRSRMSPALRQRVPEEDILQEGLLRAWRGRVGFQWRGLKSFRAWLLTLIDHCIADAATHEAALKRGSGRHAVPLSTFHNDESTTASGDFPPLISSTTPSQICILKEQAATMQSALEHLPADVIDVVRLRLFEQRPISEIAALLSIGEEAVRHRFRNGVEIYRKRLRHLISSRTGSVIRENLQGLDPDPASD
jgi:RNA polymerase sigma factor (sigma-70 family)